MSNNRIKLGVPSEEGQISLQFARGGPRPGAGRKGFGVTKKISLTLSPELWEKLERRCGTLDCSRSEAMRDMIEAYFEANPER